MSYSKIRFNALTELIENLETEGLFLTFTKPNGETFPLPFFFTDAAIDAIYDLAIASAQYEYDQLEEAETCTNH